MARGEQTLFHQILNLCRKIHQTKCVCNGRAGLRENLCQTFLSEALAIKKLPITLSLFDRGKVSPLKILNECKLKYLIVINLSNDDRNFL